MYDSEVYKRIHSEVGKIKIIDMHQHLTLPHNFAKECRIDFGRLFAHYAGSDVVSAGMPADDMMQVRTCEDEGGWTLESKWAAIKPYYERSWNTAYCESLRIAIRELYGIDDLRDDTIGPLSEKMNAVPRDTWTREVLDRSGIDIALNCILDWVEAEPVYARKRYPDLFLYCMQDRFSYLEVETLSQDSGIEIRDFKDYLRMIDWYFENFADESPAFKINRAYSRTLFFDEVAESHAASVFAEFKKSSVGPSSREMQALEDYIIHYCIMKCGEYNLPVMIHTGIQEGNGNDVRNSRAALMINLFTKYPNVKFDIFHISWPYTEELIAISKNFPNVYIDFCWAWIFNPPAARRYLSDMLETVPLNKIHGFGGDYIVVEGTYGHSTIARREIARVLEEKVLEGRFTEEYALHVAGRLLRENALENFRIPEKRRIVAERACK
jgi:predicted TIM-barrel fold metal-dependent hydrolase